MSAPLIGELVDVFVESGVNERGLGFCTLRAAGSADGREVRLLGQLSPDELREHAHGLLQAATAAEHDAAMLRVVRKLGLPEELAGHVITELRRSRA